MFCEHLLHIYACTVSTFTCTHTYIIEEGEGVPWPFAVPVLDIWAADVDLCVCVCCNSRWKHQGLALADWNTSVLLPLSVVSRCLWPRLLLSLSVCLHFSLPQLFFVRLLVCVFIYSFVWEKWPFVNLLSYDTTRNSFIIIYLIVPMLPLPQVYLTTVPTHWVRRAGR